MSSTGILEVLSHESRSLSPHKGASVLVLCMSNTIGGTENTVRTLSAALALRGLNVRTMMPQGEKAARTAQWFADGGAAVEPTDLLVNHFDARGLSYMRALGKFVRTSGADVVSVHYPELWYSYKDLLAIRVLGGKRVIASPCHPTREEWVDAKKQKTTRLAARMTNGIIVGTQLLRNRLRGLGIPDRKIHHVPYGVPAPVQTPTREQARFALGIPADAFVISTLARLEPYKGIGDLIDAVAQVPDPAGKLCLVVAGDGEKRAEWEATAKGLLGARAKFLGRVPDTAEVYAAADVFSLPSHDEGFGLVFVEAAYHGVPSIGTRIGGIPEAVIEEETGLLVPVSDPAALAKAIRCLWDDLAFCRRLGAAAQTRARTEFAVPVMAERFENVLFSR